MDSMCHALWNYGQLHFMLCIVNIFVHKSLHISEYYSKFAGVKIPGQDTEAFLKVITHNV